MNLSLAPALRAGTGNANSAVESITRFLITPAQCSQYNQGKGVGFASPFFLVLISRKKVRVQSFIVKFLECADIIFQRDTSNTLKDFVS